MYKNNISILETEKAIEIIQDKFSKLLAKELNLIKVRCPLFVDAKSGLNDWLSGYEKPVKFIPKYVDKEFEIVHSLAKWKRYILKKYCFEKKTGILTNMIAIRKDEKISNIHSLLVDQWDWEQVILKEDINLQYLKNICQKIYKCLILVEKEINSFFSILSNKLPDNINFIDSQELEDIYPNLTPKQREHEITKKLKAVFILRIGANLKSGKPHDLRAPDYDNWTLNGDLLVYNSVTNESLEISSMGIRVDSQKLIEQLGQSKHAVAKISPFHKLIVNEDMPFTIGGGIGQSRLFLFFLEKKHISEVQFGCWDDF